MTLDRFLSLMQVACLVFIGVVLGYYVGTHPAAQENAPRECVFHKTPCELVRINDGFREYKCDSGCEITYYSSKVFSAKKRDIARYVSDSGEYRWIDGEWQWKANPQVGDK